MLTIVPERVSGGAVLCRLESDAGEREGAAIVRLSRTRVGYVTVILEHPMTALRVPADWAVALEDLSR